MPSCQGNIHHRGFFIEFGACRIREDKIFPIPCFPGVEMLRPEDHQRGLRGDPRQEQPSRPRPQHPLHRLGTPQLRPGEVQRQLI